MTNFLTAAAKHCRRAERSQSRFVGTEGSFNLFTTCLLVVIFMLQTPSCSGLEDHKNTDTAPGLTLGEAENQGNRDVAEPTYRADELLVRFKDHVTPAQVEQMTGDLGLEIMREFSMRNLYLLRIKDNSSVPDVIDRLGQYEEVKYAEPNYSRTKQRDK